MQNLLRNLAKIININVQWVQFPYLSAKNNPSHEDDLLLKQINESLNLELGLFHCTFNLKYWSKYSPTFYC